MNRFCFTITACRLCVDMHSMVRRVLNQSLQNANIFHSRPSEYKSNIVQNTFLFSKAHNKIFRFQIHIKNLTQCIKPLYLFQYCRNLFYMSFLAQPNAIESHKKFSKLLQHHQCNSHITNQCKQIPETIQCKKFQSPAMFSLASINLN